MNEPEYEHVLEYQKDASYWARWHRRIYETLAWISGGAGVILGFFQGELALSLVLFGVLIGVLGVGRYIAFLLFMTQDTQSRYLWHVSVRDSENAKRRQD